MTVWSKQRLTDWIDQFMSVLFAHLAGRYLDLSSLYFPECSVSSMDQILDSCLVKYNIHLQCLVPYFSNRLSSTVISLMLCTATRLVNYYNSVFQREIEDLPLRSVADLFRPIIIPRSIMDHHYSCAQNLFNLDMGQVSLLESCSLKDSARSIHDFVSDQSFKLDMHSIFHVNCESS